MTIQQDFPTLNGYAVSWADLSFTIGVIDGADLPYPDPKDISWNSTRSRGVQKGKGGIKKARTHGSTDHTGSMTLYYSGWEAFRDELIKVAEAKGYTTNGQVVIGDVPFDILIKHKPLAADRIKIVKMKGCVIDDVGESLSESDDPDTVSLALNVMEIVQIVGTKEVIL